MASKEQGQNKEKTTAKQRSTQPEVKKLEPAWRQIHPATILHRVKANPRTLTTGDVLHLQRAIGNRAVGRVIQGAVKSEHGVAHIMRHDGGSHQKAEELKHRKPGSISPPTNTKDIPDHIKATLETTFNTNFSNVKIHTNSANALKIGALAYTQGDNIHFAPGKYNVNTNNGKKLLGHELAHVVQQRQRRVQPTGYIGGKPLNSSRFLEREADEFGEIVKRVNAVTENSNIQNRNGAVAYNVSEQENNKQNAWKSFENRKEASVRQNMQLLNNTKNTNSNVIQKMAVMAVDNMNDQKDTLVWDNIQNAVAKATGPIGDLKNNKVWDQLDDNEEIRIVEHGEVQRIGGLDANAILNSMFTAPKEIPAGKKIGGITFQSCFAGVVGDSGSSLVSDMKKGLKARAVTGVPVTGRTGVAFGFMGMGEATAETSTEPYKWKNPDAEKLFNSINFKTKKGTVWFKKLPHYDEKGIKAYCEAMYELKDKVTKNSKQKIFKTPFYFSLSYRKPWEIIGVEKGVWNSMTSEERSKRVAEDMEDYWSEIQKKMSSYGGFKTTKAEITETS